MSDLVWPSALPQTPLAASQSTDRLTTPAIETEFEYGNIELRQVSSARIRLVSVEFMMTAGEYAIFETFVINDLHGGTMSMQFPLDDYSGSRAHRIAQIVEGGAGVKVTRRGAHMLVSFQIRVYG